MRRKEEMISNILEIMEDLKNMAKMIDRNALDKPEAKRRLGNMYKFAEQIYNDLRLN